MSDSGNAADQPATPKATDRFLEAARPAGRQFLVNLKVWAPYLSNRIERERLVRFSAVDERVGLKWTVALPRQCWACGSQESLAPTEFKQTLRAYENPLAIFSGMAAFVALALLLVVFLPLASLIFMALSIAVGLALLRLKSWDEDVRLVILSCPEHAGELTRPEMAIEDQQLCVFAPSPELAQAAREEIRAKRKRGLKPYADAAAETQPPREPAPMRSESPPPQSFAPDPPSYTRPPPVELPPIKLAGEEDETPA